MAARLLQERAQGPRTLRAKAELIVDILHIDQGHGPALLLPPGLEAGEAGEKTAMGQDHEVRPRAAGVPLRRLMEAQERGRRAVPVREGQQGATA